MHHLQCTLKMSACYPHLICELNERTALCKAKGVRETVDICLLKNLKKGDYVIVHDGLAIGKLEKKDALETINILSELDI